MIKNCKQCNKEFKTSHKNAVNCSRSCRNKANPIIYTPEKIVKHKLACKGINKGEKNPAFGKLGKDSWTYGTKRTDTVRKHLSDIKRGKYRGENNPNWRGGISNEGYPEEWTKELKVFIRKSYGFTCFICHKNGYDVHHIDYNKKNCNPRNLVCLCHSCHMKTNHNRDFWKEYFSRLTNLKLTNGVIIN